MSASSIYSHALYALGFIMLCTGCVYYFSEQQHSLADLAYFVPSAISFACGMTTAITSSTEVRWLTQIDPLTAIFLVLTFAFTFCGFIFCAVGKDKAGEMILQLAFASVSFLGGLEAGMLRQRMRLRSTNRTNKNGRARASATAEARKREEKA